MKGRPLRQVGNAQVTLSTSGGKTRALIKNLHRHGARLSLEPAELDLFGPLDLVLHGEKFPCHAVWLHGKDIGVRFDVALLPFQISQLRSERSKPTGRAARSTNPYLQNRTL